MGARPRRHPERGPDPDPLASSLAPDRLAGGMDCLDEVFLVTLIFRRALCADWLSVAVRGGYRLVAWDWTPSVGDVAVLARRMQ